MYQHSKPDWQPPTDIYVTNDFIVIRVEIAGMRNSKFNAKLDDDKLIVTGQRPTPTFMGAYKQMEIRFGEFICEIPLPHKVQECDFDAKYKDGFLTITLPKSS